MTVESDHADQARRAGAGTAGQGRDGSGEATLPEAPEPAPSGATVLAVGARLAGAGRMESGHGNSAGEAGDRYRIGP